METTQVPPVPVNVNNGQSLAVSAVPVTETQRGSCCSRVVEVLDWFSDRTKESKFYDKVIKFSLSLFAVINIASSSLIHTTHIDHFAYTRGMVKFLDPFRGAAWFVKHKTELFTTKLMETIKYSFALVGDTASSTYFVIATFTKEGSKLAKSLGAIGQIAKYTGLGFLSLDFLHSCIKIPLIYTGRCEEKLSINILNIAVRSIEIAALAAAIALPLIFAPTVVAIPIILVCLAGVAAFAGMIAYFVEAGLKDNADGTPGLLNNINTCVDNFFCVPERAASGAN